MKKHIINFITVISILIMVLFSLQVVSFAEADPNMSTMISEMEGAVGNSGENKLTQGIDLIFTMIRYIGIGISVIAAMLVGIRYMTASVESKAEIKKQAVPFLVGCVLIFATSNLLGIVAKILE